MMRSGAALIEVLTAAVLAAGVMAGGVAVLNTQGSIARRTTAQSERNDAVRSVMLLLRAELEAIEPAADLQAVGRDSIAARIFRGRAIVCGSQGETVYLSYRGLRAPDPDKDSLLEVGVERAVAFTNATAPAQACAGFPAETVHAVRIDRTVQRGSVWLLFERGAFHLSGNALRYRRGAESRQPLTSEVIDASASAFAAVGDSTVRLLRVTLRDRASRQLTLGSIRMLNAP